MLSWPAVLAASYLLGSIPFPLLVSRALKGIDLRQHGSGNMGANNVRRLLGWGPAILTFLLDAAKGGAAAFLAGYLAPGAPGRDYLPLAAGVVVMAGHSWPVFAGFKGGKGLAAGLGALLVYNPIIGIQVAVGAAIYRVIFKDTSRTAVAASWTVPALAFLHFERWDLTAVGALYPLFVTATHWPLLINRGAAGGGTGGGKGEAQKDPAPKLPRQTRGIPRSVMTHAMKKGGRRR